MKATPSGLSRRLLYAGLILTLALFHLSALSTATAAGKDSSSASKASRATGTIRIGDTTFSPKDDVTSHWSDGKGWKNLPGTYVAMVDYDGQGVEVSKDGGVLTLAVAGVNRIGALKGDCSINIVGTGIVLIDSIELEGGNTISLMTDSSLYKEGSAAVFLKQEDESYLLINGGIPGILDENYRLDGVNLTVPGGSSLTLYATAFRTETWYPEGAQEPESDVTRYTTSLSDDDLQPAHGGNVKIKGSSAVLTIGPGSSLTVDEGASMQMRAVSWRSGVGYTTVKANLAIEGALNVDGLIEGGIVDVSDGGSLLRVKNGTLRSSEVNLAAAGSLSQDLLLEDCALTVAGKDEGRSVSATIKDSVIYLKGNGIFVQSLDVSGACTIGVETLVSGIIYYASTCNIGDITFSPGGSLKILANEYMHEHLGDIRLLDDCYLDISGRITGGTVSVLAGCVCYTGTQSDTLPVVPYGYASRMRIDNLDVDSSAYPLVMTQSYASEQVKGAQIPVTKLVVEETLSEDRVASTRVQGREWFTSLREDLEPLTREENQYFDYHSILEAYGLQPYEGSDYITLVEVIYSDLGRQLLTANESHEFSTEDVLMIRIIDCTTRGGQGGDSISHTETLFTGSGVLGSTGDGSVTSGKGAVVYTQQADYSPTDPEDEDEEENKDNGADDKDDKSDDESNKNQGSSDKGGNGANRGRSKSDEKNDGTSGVSGSSGSNGRGTQTHGTLTTVVTGLGNGRYLLAAYRNGTRLDSLDGSSVTVTVRNPERVTGNETCYAVFENGKSGTWIPTKYDPTTGELVFEADQVGTFGIARVLVEDVRFRGANTDAPIYHKLSVLIGNDEVTDLPNLIAVEASLPIEEGSGRDRFVVFVDDDENLHVSPVTYDKDKGTHRFEAEVTGNFVVVELAGPFKSDSELYAACRASDEVRILITLMRLYAFWS